MEINEIRSILVRINTILSKEDYNELEKYCLETADDLDYRKLNNILFYESIAEYLCEKEDYLRGGNWLTHPYFNFWVRDGIPGIEFSMEFENKTGINVRVRCFDDKMDLSAYNLVLNGRQSKKYFSDVIIDQEEGFMYRKFPIKEDFGSIESLSEMTYLKNYISEIDAKCWEFVLPKLNLSREN
jgi:hypothetical protein